MGLCTGIGVCAVVMRSLYPRNEAEYLLSNLTVQLPR